MGHFITLLVAMGSAGFAAEAEPDFVKEIKPILEARCIKCHGTTKMEGELDLSNKEGALLGGEYGPAIAGGSLEESILMQRIIKEKDDDEVMPSKGRLLTKKEIEKIRIWIEAGAPWPKEITLEEAKEGKASEGESAEGQK